MGSITYLAIYLKKKKKINWEPFCLVVILAEQIFQKFDEKIGDKY